MMKPKCANRKCSNDGWVNVGGEYYCGECAAKFDKRQKERIREEIENGD